MSQQTSDERVAWQKGYECFQPDDQAGWKSFLQLLDQLPKDLYRAAFDGWTTAVADHNRRSGPA
ncbi:MAG: hypothetical protein AB7L90_10250 [Hyphomicrobiaceae bacterium]